MRQALLSGLMLTLAAVPAAAKEAKPAAAQAEPRACPEMGPGFVRIEGTSTCIKVSGSVRAEFMTRGGSSRSLGSPDD